MATQNIAGSISFNPAFTENISTGLLTALNLPANINIQQSYTNATTGAGTIDQIHAKVYSLNSTSSVLDLLSLLDLNGNTMAFARVRDFIVQNLDSVSTHSLKVYANSTSGWNQALPGSASPLYAFASGGVVWLHDPVSATGTAGLVTGASSSKFVIDGGASNSVSSIAVLVVGNTVS